MKYRKNKRRIKDPCIKPTYQHDWDRDTKEKLNDHLTRYRCLRCHGFKDVTRIKATHVETKFEGDHKAAQNFKRKGGGYGSG